MRTGTQEGFPVNVVSLVSYCPASGSAASPCTLRRKSTTFGNSHFRHLSSTAFKCCNFLQKRPPSSRCAVIIFPTSLCAGSAATRSSIAVLFFLVNIQKFRAESRPKLLFPNNNLSQGKSCGNLRQTLQLKVYKHYNSSCGVRMKVVAPWANRKSLSRKPQRTLMQGRPLLRAVSMSTSLSPI